MNESSFDRIVAAIGQDYHIETEIGRGGMSVVYRARDVRLNRPVAIKVLPAELAHDPAIRTRFTREAQTAAQLSHPHIVPIYDVGERDGIAYLVMALVPGGSLGSLLAHEPRQPIDEVRRIVSEIADALAYAHMRGVIHRDIKPDNILLDRHTGRVMVTDFGIARAIEANARLTMTGIAVGTPTYMSPEQAVGEREVDGRSDIYSLGVLAYQMLTGRVPFTAGNSMALLLKHVTDRPQPISDLRPETPRPLRDAIERALMKSPEDRWPSAATLRDALISGEAPVASWRADNREPVRYTTPRPDNNRRDRASYPPAGTRSPSPRSETPAPPPPLVASDGLVLEPEHLASFTPTQRQDIRLWHGRIHLLDRVKAIRGYALLTSAAWVSSFGGVALGIEEEIPPFVLAPIIPWLMTRKLWRRAKSLRESGLNLRRVFFVLRAKWALPAPPPVPSERQLAKLAPREVLNSPAGKAVLRAAEDKAAILDIVKKLPKADRALLPDVVPTVNALVDRVGHLAQMFQRIDQDFQPHLIEDLDRRIASTEAVGPSPEIERRLGLLQRQRETLLELAERHAALARQLDNAVLALSNLRLDMVKLRSSGMQAGLADVSTATQQARALSHEIGLVLEAAAEMRNL